LELFNSKTRSLTMLILLSRNQFLSISKNAIKFSLLKCGATATFIVQNFLSSFRLFVSQQSNCMRSVTPAIQGVLAFKIPRDVLGFLV
jgi:hypothetical protein